MMSTPKYEGQRTGFSSSHRSALHRYVHDRSVLRHSLRYAPSHYRYLYSMRNFALLLAVCVIGSTQASTINASTFGYNVTNATAAFQAAINSAYDTVVVDLQADDWNVGPSTFTNLSDKTIIFQPGVVLRARPGAFNNIYATLFQLRTSTNITIIGYGATFQMNRSEYALLNDSEFRHSLMILSCDGVTVKGLTLRESGGDGLYVGAWGAVPYSEHITIEDVRMIDNYRQGCSITSAQHMVMRHCLFTGTLGTLPESGLDIEPYVASGRAADLVFDHCSFTANNYSGISLVLHYLDQTSVPVDITFNDCTTSNNGVIGQPWGPKEITLEQDEDPVTGTVTFNRCHVDNSQFRAVFVRKVATGFAATFNDCAFTNVSQAPGVLDNNPIWVEVTDYFAPCPPFGGVTFNNCLLTYPSTYAYMRCYGYTTTPGVQDVNFTGTVVNPNGQGLVMTSIADTINCAINASQLDAFPPTTLDHMLLQSPAEECSALPIVFEATRSGSDMSYPLPFRYDTAGTISYGDDVHLMTGSLMIPANATNATDTLMARWDGVVETPEDAVIEPVMSAWYTLSSMLPVAPQVFDCLSTQVHEAEGETIVAWPNPFTEELELTGVPPTVPVRLLNATGSVLYEGPAQHIYPGRLMPGVYMVQVQGAVLRVVKL